MRRRISEEIITFLYARPRGSRVFDIVNHLGSIFPDKMDGMNIKVRSYLADLTKQDRVYFVRDRKEKVNYWYVKNAD